MNKINIKELKKDDIILKQGFVISSQNTKKIDFLEFETDN